MIKIKKRARINQYCVACGTCITECPMKAISVSTGVKAEVDYEKCVGCGKCSKMCPASAIEIITSEVENEKQKMV